MESNVSKKIFTTRKMVSVGLLSSISIFLGMTGLGFIPFPLFNATILHIPVIIGAILEGPVVGGLIGLFFGLFSMYNAAVKPTPLSFVFLNPIISVLPRILIGIVSYYVYVLIRKLLKDKFKSFTIGFTAVVGSLTNTIVVLGLAYIIYLEKFVVAMGLSESAGGKAIALMCLTNGLPEAVVSAAITIPIILAAKKAFKR